MALRYAVANGNWSATSTWNGGTLPGNGDTVVANGFTVTIDQNVTIGGANNPNVNAGSFVVGQYYRIVTIGTTSFTTVGASTNTVGTVFLATGVGSGTGVAKALATITNGAISPAAGGGSFSITTAFSFSCDVRASSSTCLTVTGTSDVTWTGQNYTGGNTNNYAVLNNSTAGTISISSATFLAGNSTNGHAFNNASTGSVAITASTLLPYGGAHAINNASTGIITISSCSLSNYLNSAYAVNNAAGGTVNIISSTILGGTSSNAWSVNNNSNGTITITSSTLTGGSSAHAVNNASNGTIVITSSTLTASTAPAFSGSNTSANVSISGILIGSAAGFPAVYCAKWNVGTAPTGSYYTQSLNGTSTTFTWYGADYSGFGQPAVSNVRSGTTYAAGSLTGTCVIPPAGSVALGVPVDAGTGTAVLTQDAIQQAVLPLV